MINIINLANVLIYEITLVKRKNYFINFILQYFIQNNINDIILLTSIQSDFDHFDYLATIVNLVLINLRSSAPDSITVSGTVP